MHRLFLATKELRFSVFMSCLISNFFLKCEEFGFRNEANVPLGFV